MASSEQRISPDSKAASGTDSHPETSGNPRTKAKRRNRAIYSCLECRRRKLKCDRGETCENCRASGRHCVYVDSASSDAQFQRKLAETKEAKDALDGSLVNTAGTPSIPLEPSRQKRTRSDGQTSSDDSSGSDDDGYLNPSPFALQHAAYSHDADDTEEDINDLGVRFGQMWLGERIGGLYRPRIADELSSTLRRARQPLPPSSSPSAAFLSPKPVSTAPSFDLIFGQSNVNGPLTENIPPRHIADQLMEQYWSAVHPVARIVHRPSFATRYETLWEHVENGTAVTPSLAALVCAVLLSAVVSMADAQALEICHTPREEIHDQLKLGAEVALNKAQLLKSTKSETLQAFVAYLLPMCIRQISRAHSALVGMLVRLAECMGLHRDPTEFDFPPTECHARRLLWYQICYLDLKTNEIQGPRCFIQEYTTQLPLDVAQSPAPIAWNDTIFSMIRFECQEMQRRCLKHRARVDKRKMSLTKALSKIEEFRLAMDAKYRRYINASPSPPSPMQRMAGLLLKLWVSILYLIPLHRYMNSVTYRIPDRLRQIVLAKGTEVLEAAVELESAKDLKQWAWYSASYQQYHTAFLLLVEMFKFPRRREANRIWKCFDYIFAELLVHAPPLTTSGTNPALNEIIEHRALKAQFLITIISEQMRAYHKGKGQQLPSHFKKSMVTKTPGREGDDSDPRMPLNYAHGEPEASNLTTHPQPVLDASHRSHVIEPAAAQQPTAPPKGDTSSVPPTFPPALDDATNPWPSSEHFSPWVQANETDIDGFSTHLNPGHYYGCTSTTPTGSLSTSQPAAGESDLQMLEIDWDLWDTIFPPQANDGMLDIGSDYLWDPSVPGHENLKSSF